MPRKLLHTALLLLVALFSYADEKSLDTLVLKSLVTSRVLPQERVYLHFDNSGYYLGETMWFKAYCVGGNGTTIAAPQSKVLYVELCAPEGYVVETKKFKLDEKGCCNGEFELKPSLLSGYYEVRAYTRYMLNWGDDAVFSRVFPVYDKVNGDNYDFMNMLDRKRGFLYRGKWVTQEGKEPTLAFYPEGGHLINGIETKVAYELRDKSGKPLNDIISIFADEKLLLTTKAIHNGKGYFMFTPQTDVKYRAEVKQVKNQKNKKNKAEVKEIKKIYKFELPTIEYSGATIAVKQDGDSIRFSVAGNILEQSLGFVILNRNQTYVYKKNIKELAMHRDKLREGVNRCLLLTADGTPLSERMFFVKHSAPQQGDIVPVKLKAEINGFSSEDNQFFKPYRKLTVKISSKDGSPLPNHGSYSVAVTDEENSVVTSYSNNIYTQMLLASELKGYIPAASQYFADDTENTRNNLDLLMLTHGWTSYDWGMLTGTDSTFSIKHPIENGIQLNGYFMKKEKVKKWGQMGSFKIIPLKGIKVYFDIAYDGNGVTNYEFTTEKNGKFQLELEDFYGKRYTALTPILTGKQIQDTIFKFSMNKYFSPKFRLYDYWQWNRGYRPGNKKAGNMQAIDIFGRNKLEEVDVTAKKHIGPTNRPPRSEIRLDFMDEWEYAQDVSYIHTPQDNWVMNKVSDTGDIFEDVNLSNEEENKLYAKYDYTAESNYISKEYNYMALTTSTDNWRVYGWEGPRHHAYENVLTAYEVLQSAFWRHNYNWAYWVKMIVPQGEYSSDAIPIEDKEYIKGKDPIKMMNFKEIVIRSDEPTLQQFKNEGWYNQRTAFLNKGKFRSFYFGFLLRSSITPQDDKLIDEYPGNATFRNRMARKNLKKLEVTPRGEESSPNETRKNIAGNDVIDMEKGVRSYNTDLIFQQKMYPEHPNFVACFIPNKGKDKVSEGLVPDIAVKSVRRYTCIQGYNRSKKFYSPNYSRNKPDKNTKDYRRTLFWIPNAEVGNDGCITFKLYNNSKESVLLLDVAGMKEGNFYAIE
ncbi:MAG: hypothetical protein E7089_01495 [Bacteroidales bacterium]|nr:hypothetical protein [Bacteroidales bacterium]